MANNQKFWAIAAWMFWAFYATFLFSSIPHLAEWFRHMDGIQQGAADTFYWILAYGKSIAADGTDVLLTLAFLRMISISNKTAWDQSKILMTVLFIVGFTAFSWYINWQYETQFVTSEFARADSQVIFFGMNVGASNPAVGSAFQLFALIFTFISDTIMKKSDDVVTVKDLATLRKDAEDARERATLERQILDAKKIAKAGIIERFGEQVEEVKKVGKKLVTNSVEANQEGLSLASETEVVSEVEEPVTEDLDEIPTNEEPEEEQTFYERQNEPSTDPEMEATNVTQFPETGSKTNARITVPLNIIDIATRRKPLTISEAVQVLGVSEKTVREWKRSGKLSTVQDGKYISVSSVRKIVAQKA